MKKSGPLYSGSISVVRNKLLKVIESINHHGGVIVLQTLDQCSNPLLKVSDLPRGLFEQLFMAGWVYKKRYFQCSDSKIEIFESTDGRIKTKRRVNRGRVKLEHLGLRG